MQNYAAPLNQLYEVALVHSDCSSAAKECLLEARNWHKFIVAPQDIGDQLAPAKYADDLRYNGLFRLPYDELVIQCGPFSRRAGEEGYTKDYDLTMIVVAQYREGIISGRIFRVFGPGRCGVGGGTSLLRYPLSLDRKTWADDLSSSFLIPDYGERFDDTPSSPDEIMHCEKSMFTLPIFQLVGLCNADGITIEEHREPKFINRKRAESGKPPLFGYHLVTIDPKMLRMAGVASDGMSHASPRLHWRRGHVRVLQSGRRTLVRPCLVGDRSRGMIDKDYRTRSYHEPPPLP